MVQPYQQESNLSSQEVHITQQVLEIGKIAITGNIVPSHWYQTLTFANGKPHFVAVTLLSDIVYWYRPTEVRDEHTGQVIGLKKKFRADFLQRQTKAYSKQFGFSEKQIQEALKYLEDNGYIKRHFRDINLGVDTGTLSNRQFIELIPSSVEKIQKIATYTPTGRDPTPPKSTPRTPQVAYTNTTTKSSSKSSKCYSPSSEKKEGPPQVLPKKKQEEIDDILATCTPEQKKIYWKLVRKMPENKEDRMIRPLMCARIAQNNSINSVEVAILVYDQDCIRKGRKGSRIDSMEAYIVAAINNKRIPMSEEAEQNREYFIKWSKDKHQHHFELVDKYVVFKMLPGTEVTLNMKDIDNFKKQLDDKYQSSLGQGQQKYD